MNKLVKVAANDFKLVFRDNSLKAFLAIPLITLPVIRYGVPYVAGVYGVLQDYISIILMLATMQGSVAFGFIYSMVLVDEKDKHIGQIYGILPVSKFWFVVFRLIPPFALAATATFLLLLVEPFYNLPVFPILVYSTLTGLVAPLMIMIVAILAANKIQAMTWQKLFNIPLYLPIAAFFVPASFSLIFAVFPPFWAYQTLNSLITGNEYWVYITFGYIHSILLIVFLVKQFTKSHFK